MNITDALILASKGHDKQKRKDGSAYIYHPILIANALKNKGYDEEFQIVGLLHDTLEDTNITEQQILDVSNEKVLDAVKLLTKSKDTPEEVYIEKILENPIAKAVKNEDRIYNLQDAKNLPFEQSVFIKKYLDETKKYFVGKFSDELDQLFNELTKYYKYITSHYIYSINPSMTTEMVYRTDSRTQESQYCNGKKWIDYPNIISENGDDLLTITLEEAEDIIHMTK